VLFLIYFVSRFIVSLDSARFTFKITSIRQLTDEMPSISFMGVSRVFLSIYTQQALSTR